MQQKGEAVPTQQNLMQMRRLMAQVVLQHDKALQLHHRRECFVLFVQSSPGSALTVLTQQTLEWRNKMAKEPEHPKWLNLRTYLLRSLILELQQRLVKLSQSTGGQALWDKAVSEGAIQADGSWPFMKWCHSSKKMIHSHRPPMSMARALKDVQYLSELLEENGQVLRFHGVKPQATIVPWLLQVSMREQEVWRILESWAQSSLWTLIGVSLKVHSQLTSKPAQALEAMLHNHQPKGRGKGATKKES